MLSIRLHGLCDLGRWHLSFVYWNMWTSSMVQRETEPIRSNAQCSSDWYIDHIWISYWANALDTYMWLRQERRVIRVKCQPGHTHRIWLRERTFGGRAAEHVPLEFTAANPDRIAHAEVVYCKQNINGYEGSIAALRVFKLFPWTEQIGKRGDNPRVIFVAGELDGITEKDLATMARVKLDDVVGDGWNASLLEQQCSGNYPKRSK